MGKYLKLFEEFVNEEKNVIVKKAEKIAKSYKKKGYEVDINDEKPSIIIKKGDETIYSLKGKDAKEWLDDIPYDVDKKDFIIWMAYNIEVLNESTINEARIEQSFSVGDEVMIHPDNDNNSYNNYMNMSLIITDVATDEKDHPGFDDSIGQALYDLQTKRGEQVPFSLYDFELIEA